MKKYISIIILLVLVFSALLGLKNISNATDSWSSIVSGADGFLGKAQKEEIDNGDLKRLSGTLFNILLILAIIITVIVGIFIGIKLVSASAEGKAQMKETLLPYIIGNVVVFGAFGIWKLVVTILNSVT